MTLLSRIPLDGMLAVRDRYFAPTVLLPFADDMARRLARLSIGPVLEIAAGTGVLTQAIALSLSAGMTIVATDPSADMIRHASSRPGMARVAWQQADPLALTFKDATFGIITCHVRIATMPDRVRAFREARRVMKQGGRFVFSVLGSLQHNPVAACLQEAMDATFPADPPRFIADGPHGYANQQTIDDDLTTAGFTDAIYTVVDLPFVAASARDVALGYCLGTPLRSEIELRISGDSVEPVLQAATLALQQRFGAGAIESTMRAQFISAAG
jgi:ubiquinone/menaquinone biosynthesis C-methylase UbiE